MFFPVIMKTCSSSIICLIAKEIKKIKNMPTWNT